MEIMRKEKIERINEEKRNESETAVWKKEEEKLDEKTKEER